MNADQRLPTASAIAVTFRRPINFACLVVLFLIAERSRADLIQTPVERAAPELFGTRSSAGFPEIQRLLEEAWKCFQDRDYDQCLERLSAAVKKQPQLPPSRLMLSRLFLLDNQLARGRAMLEKAAAEQPDCPGTNVTFGELALTEGRLTDALVHFEKALLLADGDRGRQNQNIRIEIHSGLAAVAAQREDWSLAKSHLSACRELDPKRASVRQRFAQAVFQLGDSQTAYEELKRAEADDPRQDPAAVTMGWFHTQKGDLQAAGKWMEQAVERNPHDPKVQRGIATWLFRHGRAENAAQHAEIAANLDPASKETKVICGLIARKLKKYAEAEALFQAIYQDSPADSSASNQLALVLVEQPDKQKQIRALQLAEVNARLFPNSLEVLSTLGWIYYRFGKINEAEQALRAVVSSSNARPEATYYLAHIMSDRREWEAVKDLLKKSIEASGSFMFRDEAEDWLARLNKQGQ